MMVAMLYVPLALLVGAFIPVQTAANSRLRQSVGNRPIVPALVSFSIALTVTIIATVLIHGNPLPQFDQSAINPARFDPATTSSTTPYPWWIWLDAPAMGMQFVPRYAENSMTRDGEHIRRIAAAAGQHGVYVSFGFSERAGGSLYMSQALISDAGRVIAVRRKLKPTHVERSVWA